MSSDDLKELCDQRSNVVCEMKKYIATYEKCYEQGSIDSASELQTQLMNELRKMVVDALGVLDTSRTYQLTGSTKTRTSVDDVKELRNQRSNVVCEMKKYIATYEKCYEKRCFDDTFLELRSQLQRELQRAVDDALRVVDAPFMRNQKLPGRDSGCVNSDYAPDFSVKRDSNRRTSDSGVTDCDIHVGVKIHGSKSTVSLTTHADISPSSDPADIDMQTPRTSLPQPLTMAVQETRQNASYHQDPEQTFAKEPDTDC